MSEVLLANIVHPNLLVRETAAITLHYKDPGLFDDQSKILRYKIVGLNEIIKKVAIEHNIENLLILEKLKLIRSLPIFSDLGYLGLTDLAINSKEIVLKTGEKLNLGSEDKNTIYICLSGFLKESKSGFEIHSGDLISIYNSLNGGEEFEYIAEDPSLILKSRIYLINKLFAENYEFAKKITENIISNI
jgi:hypothetical protein